MEITTIGERYASFQKSKDGNAMLSDTKSQKWMLPLRYCISILKIE
jgi:hypothetical protein